MQQGLTPSVPEKRLSTQIALIASTLTVLFILAIGGVSYYITRIHIIEGIQKTLIIMRHCLQANSVHL